MSTGPSVRRGPRALGVAGALCAAFASGACATPGAAASWWKRGEAACPDGTHLGGVVGDRLWCQTDDGLCHGPWAGWYEGELRAVGTYRYGLSDGAEITWDSNGGCVLRHFRDGRLHGEVLGWRPGGRLWFRRAYGFGQRVGRSVEWDETGRVERIEEWDHDHRVLLHPAPGEAPVLDVQPVCPLAAAELRRLPPGSGEALAPGVALCRFVDGGRVR